MIIFFCIVLETLLGFIDNLGTAKDYKFLENIEIQIFSDLMNLQNL